MYNSVFEQVKSALDMRTVAEGYGLKINRAGMVLCPFHDEKTPSAKIYPDSFHCFGCGVHGDVISFTQQLFNLARPIDAVQKLSADFGLHITSDKPTKAEISEYQKRAAERKEYEQWERSAFDTLHEYLWLMRSWRALAPDSAHEPLDERFVYSLTHLEYAEYLAEAFLQSDKSGRRAMGNTVAEWERFLQSGRFAFCRGGVAHKTKLSAAKSK